MRLRLIFTFSLTAIYRGHTPMDKLRLPVIGLLLGMCTADVPAQVNASTPMESTTSNYYFAKPNELTMSINVMGFVQRPGRYEISNTIDLINLMALAGGATADGSMGDVKITRITGSEGRVVMREIHVNLEDVGKLTSNELRLLPGDTIQVDRTGWSGFRDTFALVVGAAVITGAIAQVLYATKH
jgi:hypothetical protein